MTRNIFDFVNVSQLVLSRDGSNLSFFVLESELKTQTLELKFFSSYNYLKFKYMWRRVEKL